MGKRLHSLSSRLEKLASYEFWAVHICSDLLLSTLVTVQQVIRPGSVLFYGSSHALDMTFAFGIIKFYYQILHSGSLYSITWAGVRPS